MPRRGFRGFGKEDEGLGIIGALCSVQLTLDMDSFDDDSQEYDDHLDLMDFFWYKKSSDEEDFADGVAIHLNKAEESGGRKMKCLAIVGVKDSIICGDVSDPECDPAFIITFGSELVVVMNDEIYDIEIQSVPGKYHPLNSSTIRETVYHLEDGGKIGGRIIRAKDRSDQVTSVQDFQDSILKEVKRFCEEEL